MTSFERRFVDLSHTVESGMITYRGLPAPAICDFLSREDSRALYDDDAEFHIGRIDMVANTGTYIDAPFHRFVDGADVAGLTLSAIADVPGLVIRAAGSRAIDVSAISHADVSGCAVLVHTGWAEHWRSDEYFDAHPHLTGAAAEYLRDSGAVLVGIDAVNIDDTTGRARPVHTTLLAAGIPIVEHLRGLELLPDSGFRFSAVPVKVRGLGSFPVRAFAKLPS